jgi:hypothetical protein
MIQCNFTLYNPWTNTWKILWNKNSFVGKNKACEFNGYRTNRIVDLDFDLRFRGDHAGARVMLGLLGYSVELHVYDTRHWNWDTNTWETYD